MSSDPDPRDGSREISDLVGAEIALALTLWLLVTLVCFFLVGAVVGMILVAAGVFGFGWYAVSVVRRADIED